MRTAAPSCSDATDISTRAPASRRRSHSRITCSTHREPRPDRVVADDAHVLVSTLDPDGRVVELSAESWSHILEGHPELAPHLDSVAQAVREPDRRRSGRHEHEEWFYLAGAGPTRWLKVVVHYEGVRGRIVTAFGRRSMP